MRVLATKVPDDVYEAFKERARREGLSVSELLRRVVCEYLRIEKGKPGFTYGLPTKQEFEELRRRVEKLEEELRRLVGTGRNKQVSSKSRRVVRWLRRSLRSPESCFRAVGEREGDEVLWVEKSDGLYCYALRSEVEEVINKLNTEGATLDEVIKESKYVDAKELHECGLIWYDTNEGKWKIT